MSTVSTNMLQLPVVTGLDGTEWCWVVQGGTDKRATTAQVASLATGGGAFAQPVIIDDATDPGAYTVPDSVTWLINNKTDGGNIILGTIADKVGSVLIVGAQAGAFPFNVVVTDGTIMGSLTQYPFSADYQSVRFAPVPDLDTWTV